MRVALFITCFNDTLFPATGKAMERGKRDSGKAGRVRYC